ncbi:MAG: glycosyltransferase [Burkholderiales bacterium]|nr:glycosyltransferase [Burkholderiales bacterium]
MSHDIFAESSATLEGGAYRTDSRMPIDRTPRVAIVHDWLVTYAGAERVLEQMIACFPQADIFSLVDFVEDRKFLRGKRATTSFIQRLPFARKKYRAYLPLMPLAIEQLDLSAYDLVISSSHAVAKGVLTGPDQVHISYVHSPIRYAWDLQHQYLAQSNLTRGLRSIMARVILHYIRNWDCRTANSVDHFVANSQFIARRIKKVYQRRADVIFPPVDVQSFVVGEQKEDFYLTASRMVPYKKIDLIVEAFSRMPGKRLIVIGDGPEMKSIRAKAGPNVEILGYQPFAVLHDHMRRAKAFVFAAEEDFGIAPVEAQACGTPVIAFGKGGVLETVRELGQPHPTGLFFREQTVPAVVAAVREFEAHAGRFSALDCRANAERFSITTFRERFMRYVEHAMPGATRHGSGEGLHGNDAASGGPKTKAEAAPVRVLALDQGGGLDQAEASLLSVASRLKDSLEFVLFDDGPSRLALEEAGVAVDVLDAPVLRGMTNARRLPRSQTLTGMASLVRETARRARHVDVIYANTPRAMVVGALAGMIARRPVVWHLRKSTAAYPLGRVQRAALKWCARIALARAIADSAASKEAFEAFMKASRLRIDIVDEASSAPSMADAAVSAILGEAALR